MVALVVGREATGNLEVLPESLVGLPAGRGGAKEEDVRAVRLARVNGGPGTVANLGLLLGEKVGELIVIGTPCNGPQTVPVPRA